MQLVRRVGIGPGPGPSSAREECTGPLVETVDCCLRFLARHTRRFESVTGTRRDALPEYPEAVLREAVVNALAHRDYGLDGATVDITVWDDRIEVRSPGPLPGHITIDNMRDEHYSRNPRIMRVLKTVGLVEECGDGLDRMYREMESRLMEPPAFEATASSVTVTLRNRFLVEVEDQIWLILLARVGRRGGSRYVLSEEVVLRAGDAGMALQNRRRQTLLDEVRRRGSISTTEAALLVNATPATARALLDEFVKVGLFEARGRTRARRYHLR